MCKLYVRNSHQCLVIANQKSTEHVKKAKQWKDLIDKYIDEIHSIKVPSMLVFSKSDQILENAEEIDYDLISQKYGFCDVLDVSALNGNNIEKLLDDIIGHFVMSGSKFVDNSDIVLNRASVINENSFLGESADRSANNNKCKC